jgi:hypothetical protein
MFGFLLSWAITGPAKNKTPATKQAEAFAKAILYIDPPCRLFVEPLDL